MSVHESQAGTAPTELWRPKLDGSSRIERFAQFVAGRLENDDPDYEALHRWSVRDPEAFWTSIWEFFDPPRDGQLTPAVDGELTMPGTHWFPQLSINYAEAMLAMPGRADDDVVIIARSETRDERQLTAAELRDQVARARTGLQRAGVGRGDVVAAYAPNLPETLVLLLAAASLGATFCSCAPEFGTRSVTDRLAQVEPKVLLAIDGYRYGDKTIDRSEQVASIVDALDTLAQVVLLRYLEPEREVPKLSKSVTSWDDFTADVEPLQFDRVPFGHPLWVLFSSGTTGLPKAIVHGHGGIVLEHLKLLGLQMDLSADDTYFWFSTTGWAMWNMHVSGLLVGAALVLYDGDPLSQGTDWLWRIGAETDASYFGASAPYLHQCRRDGVRLADVGDFSRLRFVGSSGAPLSVDGFRWVYANVAPSVQLQSVAGGTDIGSAFVGTNPMLPVYEGMISGRCLGVDVQAFDEQGHAVIGEVGEMVVCTPMPSMPVFFWGDDGTRYREAYFEVYPGHWRHGDWIEFDDRGACVISGRSDATLNRGGVRLGTADFYAVLDVMPEIADSLVVHLEDPDGGSGRLVVFLVTSVPADSLPELCGRIRSTLRSQLSPRHVPEEIRVVSALPRTLTGKRIELPIKRILQGLPVEQTISMGSITHPESLHELVDAPRY